MNKYKLTGKSTEYLGRTLHEIQALRDFGNVSNGEKGGWIEKEENLSQDGNAWVYSNAVVSEDAVVSGNAQVFGNAWVYGNARVSGNAQVFGNAWVYGNAWVSGAARVSGDVRVFGDAWVYGNAQVFGNLQLSSGYCFAYKKVDWDVTEIENGDCVLLVRDYKEPAEKRHTIVIDGKEIEVSEESYNELKSSLN
jgi:hypothetical protein